MYVFNKTQDYDGFTSFTDNEDDDMNIILKDSPLSIPSGVFLPSLYSLSLWTTPKPLLANK